jgi:hypothetical protein
MEETLKIRLTGNLETKKVYADDHRVDIDYSLTIKQHSSEFFWGYNGSGPAQLALAVMLRVFSKKKALDRYQEFKEKVIALIPKQDFAVTIDMDNFKIIEP